MNHVHSEGYKDKKTGNIIITKAAAPCEACAAAGSAFFKLQATLGTYELARRIEKTKSYRAYRQKWPFDGTGTILSLDYFADQGLYFQDDSIEMEDALASKERLAEFMGGLTPRQRRIATLIGEGFQPKDFYEAEGYQNTGGIRYHKWIMRKKFNDLDD